MPCIHGGLHACGARCIETGLSSSSCARASAARLHSAQLLVERGRRQRAQVRNQRGVVAGGGALAQPAHQAARGRRRAGRQHARPRPPCARRRLL